MPPDESCTNDEIIVDKALELYHFQHEKGLDFFTFEHCWLKAGSPVYGVAQQHLQDA